MIKETKKEIGVLSKKRFILLRITGFAFLAIVSFCFLFLGAIRLVYAPILRASNRITAPGIDLMETVEIGGVKQVLYFRGEDIENPVILYLHGGPGSPYIPSIHGFQYDLEKDFTFVQWDQRNTGKTFRLNDPDYVLETLSLERAIEDAYEITRYIKQKLNKDKIVIIGHSWGSVLGTALVQKYPQEYSAYIGIGQVINMRENERVGYRAVLDTAREAGNKNDISALEALAPYPPPIPYSESFIDMIIKVRGIQGKYGVASVFDLNILFLMFTSPYYSLGEIMIPLNSVKKLQYQEPLMRFLFDEYDIHDFGVTYDIPVFYIMGENDYNTPYPLAKEFFEEILAPKKIFFTIHEAGHEPMLDNKAEFIRVMVGEIRPLL